MALPDLPGLFVRRLPHHWTWPALVARWVDGDTVDVVLDTGFATTAEMRLRLFGIDTPETRTRDLDEKRRGRAAHARVRELAPEGSRVLVRTIPTPGRRGSRRGSLGRYLVEIWPAGELHETSINQILLDEGHAVPYAR